MVTLMLLINFLQKMRLVLCRLLLQLNKLTNFKNFKKHFKKGITPLLCALTIFNLCGIHVNATPIDSADYVYDIHVNEPFVSDYSGYFALTRYVSAYVDYLFYWQVTFTSNNQLDENTQSMTNVPVSIDLTFLNNGVKFSAQSYYPCIITIYNIPSWSGNTGVELARTLVLNPGSVSSVVIDWDYDSISIPYGYAYGKYHAIYKGNTNLNTAIRFFGEYEISEYISQINSNVISLLNNSNAINNNIISAVSYLYDIKNILSPNSSSESPEDVSSSGITNVTNKEQELLNKNDSVSNDINNLDVDINPNASAVTWNLVNTAVMSNSKVFTMFLSILTIGIIGLILNR